MVREAQRLNSMQEPVVRVGALSGDFCLNGCLDLKEVKQLRERVAMLERGQVVESVPVPRDNIPSRDVIPAGVTRIKRYLVSSDGTAKDTVTGLTWMRCLVGQEWNGQTCVGEAKTFKWKDAIKQGYGDWRVPSIEKLRTLVYCSNGQPDYFSLGEDYSDNDSGCKGEPEKDHDVPTLVAGVFPNNPAYIVWSGSPVANYSYYAWSVNFDSGVASDYYDRHNDSYVRLVRSGQ